MYPGVDPLGTVLRRFGAGPEAGCLGQLPFPPRAALNTAGSAERAIRLWLLAADSAEALLLPQSVEQSSVLLESRTTTGALLLGWLALSTAIASGCHGLRSESQTAWAASHSLSGKPKEF